MIILMFTNTNSMQFRALESFFNPIQVKWTLRWDSLFEGYEWDHSPKKESLTEMTICLVKPSKYFLSMYMACYLYLDTLLWSYLSPETNGVIMLRVDHIIYPHTWATAHFWLRLFHSSKNLIPLKFWLFSGINYFQKIFKSM